MAPKLYDRTKIAVYPDHSTLCDAFRAHRNRPDAADCAAYRPLREWFERVAREANLCLSMVHLVELAAWGDEATADEMARWYAPRARELIDRLVQALHGLDPKKKNKQSRLSLMLRALEAATEHHQSYLAARDGGVVENSTVRLDGFLNGIVNHDLRMQMAESIVRGVWPSVKLPKGVLARALELWPQTKQREARTRALHDLAKAIGCDRPTLLTQLRQVRMQMRDQRRTARRK
jgi:hypothetical protein